jgi:enterochelin esterase-like enzyme
MRTTIGWFGVSALGVLCGLSPCLVGAQGTAAAARVGRIESARLRALSAELEAGDTAALRRFWSDIARDGAPLVEPFGGDSASRLVTFLLRSQADVRVLVVNDFSHYLPQSELHRLGASDVWYSTVRVPSGSRFMYHYTIDDPAYPYIFSDTILPVGKTQRDTLNPKIWSFGQYRLSVVELPGALSLSASERKPSAPRGTVGQFTTLMRSERLGNERKIFVYRPASYADSLGPYPLLVFGSSYINQIRLPIILDNLIAEGRIPPVVAIFVDHDPARQDLEMGCMAEYGDFLATELLPWVRQRLRVTSDPAKTIIGGASAGGSSAACVALRHPEAFGNVISQSGAFWRGMGETADYWGDPARDAGREGFAHLVASSERVPVRFYMTIGLLERGRLFYVDLVSMIHSNRHVRDVLQARGYTFFYHEVAASHDPFNWEATLPQALITLLAR